MQTITPALEALLKAKLQAGSSGFRGRIELERGVTTTTAVRVRATAVPTFSTSALSPVPFGAIDHGADAAWWAGQATRVVALTSGRHRIGASIHARSGDFTIGIRINGTTLAAAQRTAYTPGGGPDPDVISDTIETLVDLAVGDYAELVVSDMPTIVLADVPTTLWMQRETGVAARISRSTNQTLADQTNTAASFDTVAFDDGGYWSAGAPTHVTIPSDGTYRITAHCPWENLGSTFPSRQLGIRLNGAAFLASRRNSPATSWTGITVSTEYRFSAGEYVTVDLFQQSGVSLDALADAAKAGIVVTIVKVAENATRVRRTTAQTASSGVEATVSWEAERYDDGALWAAGTALVMPEGLHYICASLAFLGVGGNSRSAYLRVNGATIAAYGHLAAPAPGGARSALTISSQWYFAAGDHLEVVMLQDSGLSVDISVNVADSPELSASTVADAAIATSSTRLVQPQSISIDKSLRMTADQATIVVPNEGLPMGWGPDSVVSTNTRVRAYQWYGDPANEVLAFTGVVDQVTDHRDVLATTIAARDMMAILIDQTFGATAPQASDETGAVRTPANGVYLSMEGSDIVADILDRAGWPTADRAITPTSYTFDEYVIPDGQSWAEAIIGEDRICGLTGYEAWADEAGVFHFAPIYTSESLTDPGTPAYTFRTGEDIVSLDDAVDQYELRTRCKVRGPLTTTTLTDTWREVWRTGKFSRPVGLWYDPADSGNLRVLDRGTKRLYKLRLSDRAVLSSVYLGSVIPYPLGVSGDPSDSTIYWVLNAPWLWGSGSSSSIKKVRKSDNHVLATYTLDSDHWSAIKVSGAWLYLSNLTDDRVYRRSKTTGAAHDSYRHTYSSTLQSNPAGLMIDGTTISTFWSNGGTTARFLQSDESAPGTVTKVVKTAGTALHGGEMDTITHTRCWGDSDSLHLVAQFTLLEATSQTSEVYAEVVDTALEDELGSLAQSQDRTHDTHPGDAIHPFEIRRDTLDVTAIVSLAQATETAARRLELLGRRRRVLDAGILGNPALQKTDVVRVEDPVTGIARRFSIDTYRSQMDDTYLGTLALIPVDEPDDTPTDDGDATE